MESFSGPDGQQLYFDRTEGTRGSKGPFYVVYADEDAQTRWGFRCGNCGTVDNAVDAMGRIQCNECSNRTKAEEWDAAHE
jgi:DNA-directed RNA polymerase subunit RPC12/RpoP